ncbi:hypothetical protein B7463_g6860, partial [Scytalidium lignicola]
MTSPPPAKKGRKARRYANMAKYCPDSFSGGKGQAGRAFAQSHDGRSKSRSLCSLHLHAALDDRPELGLECAEDGVRTLKCAVCLQTRMKGDFRKAERKCIKCDEAATCSLCGVTAHQVRFSKNQYSLARDGGGLCLCCQKWVTWCDEHQDKPPPPPPGADMDKDETERWWRKLAVTSRAVEN